MAAVTNRRGDLLDQTDVDVIVNSWNRNFIPWWLLLPQGISGAIKKRGGYQPFIEVGRRGMLRAGDAVLTGAGRLPFKAVIHVAALTACWTSSEDIVRRCTRSALDIAAERGFGSIGFPLMGAGSGGVRPERARDAIVQEAANHPCSGHVVVVEFPKQPHVQQRARLNHPTD